MKILEKFTKQELIDLLNSTKSFRDFLIKIGSSFNGSASYTSIKKQLEKLEIKIPNYKKLKNERFDRKSNEKIFTENSNFSRYWLKDRIIKHKLIKYECEICKNKGEWLGIKLSLQLEHKNGVNNDNRLENLTFLCPNCHSQTSTYSGKKNKKETKINKNNYIRKDKYCECGKKIHRTSQRCSDCAMKNIRKIERPSYIQIISDIEELGYCGTGRKYNVSDNTIRKWLKNYNKTEK
jgi:5-methylcytosine-specific restriction endonuclease McrA